METITLDREMVEALRTDRGGFTKATVTALGLHWKALTKGWPAALVGTQIALDDYELAVAGRNELSKVTLKIRAKRDRRKAARMAANPVHAELDRQFEEALDREAR